MPRNRIVPLYGHSDDSFCWQRHTNSRIRPLVDIINVYRMRIDSKIRGKREIGYVPTNNRNKRVYLDDQHVTQIIGFKYSVSWTTTNNVHKTINREFRRFSINKIFRNFGSGGRNCWVLICDSTERLGQLSDG